MHRKITTRNQRRNYENDIIITVIEQNSYNKTVTELYSYNKTVLEQNSHKGFMNVDFN